MARITITDEKFYEKLVDYCKLNGKKVGDFCTKLLKEAFMSELYDDVPFGKPKKAEKESEPVIQEEKVEEAVKVEEKPVEIVAETKEEIIEERPVEPEVKARPKKRRL